MKPVPTDTREIHGHPDYRLVIASMERKILADEDLEKTRRILATRRIWQAMPVDCQIRWAHLAQMAGDMDTALAVLAEVNRNAPENVEAWKNRIGLTAILGRGEETARVLAMARQQVGGEALAELEPSALFRPEPEPDRHDPADIPGPFEQLRSRQQQIARYLTLFSGRREAFARQWVDRRKMTQGYVPVRRAMTQKDAEDHLAGRLTYGIYLLREDSTVTVGVIDADLQKAFRAAGMSAEQKRQVTRERGYLISRIKDLAAKIGLSPLLEFSGGKGYHFWFFFSEPLSAARVKSLLCGIRDQVAPDLQAFALEVFPKQDQLGGKGFGNLVKLPLGVHRMTGKPSVFPECADRSLDGQLDFLSGIVPASLESIRTFERQTSAQKVVAHPRLQRWAEEFPEFYSLESRCPPLGQIIALCREGRTLGPRELQVLFQTVGFLPRAKTLVHHLLAFSSEYNPHLVDFRLSRIRGTPLGCRRIHELLSYVGDECVFDRSAAYRHPLLHVKEWREEPGSVRSEKIENINDALENLRSAVDRALTFMR
jgi:hypothetical protein